MSTSKLSTTWRLSGGSRPLALIATLVVLGGISILVPILIKEVLWEGRRSVAYFEALELSLQRRSEIGRLFANIQEAENEQRGFLLNGNNDSLVRYTRVARELPSLLNALQATVVGTRLEPTFTRLAETLPIKLNELARAVATYQQNGSAAAAKIVAEGSDKLYMNEIRLVVDQMLAIENDEIESLSAEVREQTVTAQTILFVLFGTIILAVFGAGAAGLIHIVQRQKAERDLREAWETAERAQHEAEEASRAKSEFLTTMSHEIRTPLHAVIGSAEIALDDHTLTSKQGEYLERIQVSGTALLNLVNDVLDLAKIEAGEIEIIPESFSLERLLDNSVSIVRMTALKKNLNLRMFLDHGLPLALLGDEARLRQVLLNLLGNAVKFTQHGEVSLHVEHRGSTKAGEKLQFSVVDTGPGIPVNQRKRLFRRFSQISPSARRSGGTGLGLAISKQLVELMGGELDFDSEEGRGSTFRFSLTLPQVEADLPSELGPERSTEKRSGRLLVVDDLDQNRDLARKMLETDGYTVELAADGAEAIKALLRNRYDLVLMDIQMACMDGVSAAMFIRGMDGPARDVPIIAMTANVLAHDVKLFKAAGMNDHLGKPFRRKQLLDKVRQWLPAASVAGGAIRNEVAEKRQDAGSNTIEDLCSAMGRDWVVRGLSELVDQLERILGDIRSAESVDPDGLARQAHMMVSRAGILGFSELARACSALEQACKQGLALGAALSKVEREALQVQPAAREILCNLGA